MILDLKYQPKPNQKRTMRANQVSRQTPRFLYDACSVMDTRKPLLNHIPVMAVAVSEPDVDAIIEEPIEVEDCDVPVLLEDPPAPALVELSPGHAAAVGNFTFALSLKSFSEFSSVGAGCRRGRILTCRTLAARPQSSLVKILVVLRGKSIHTKDPTLLVCCRTLLFYTARDASDPILVRAYTLYTDAAFGREGCSARFLTTLAH